MATSDLKDAISHSVEGRYCKVENIDLSRKDFEDILKIIQKDGQFAEITVDDIASQWLWMLKKYNDDIAYIEQLGYEGHPSPIQAFYRERMFLEGRDYKKSYARF